MNALRYLWAHPYGRLAILGAVVGVVGLTAHFWMGFLLLAGLRLPPRTTRHYSNSARRNQSTHYTS